MFRVKSDILNHLPLVTGSLLDINDLDRQAVVNHRIHLHNFQEERTGAMAGRLATLDILEGEEPPRTDDWEHLAWLQKISSAAWAAGNFNDMVRGSLRSSMGALVRITDNVDALRTGDAEMKNRARYRLISMARAVISHTPYAKAFRSDKFRGDLQPSLAENIEGHQASYTELLPYMDGRQYWYVKKTIKSSN